MHIRTLFLMALGTLFITLPHAGFAHEEAGTADPYEQVYRYGNLFERISHLELDSEQMEKQKPAVPYFYSGGKKIYIGTNAFYQVTEEISRIFTDDIKSVCPECRLPTPQEINEKVEELVAKGWFEHTTEKVVDTIAIRYGSEFVDLGARYGTMAGVLKVLGELAEDALLVVFKMPGAHFLCEVITLGISFYSGGLLTIYRTWRNGAGLGQNGLMQLVRLSATSWAAKRSLKRIQLEIGPVEVDPDLMDPEREKSESKEWIAEEIDHEKKFKRFFERIEARVKKYDGQIAELEAKLENASARDAARIQRRITHFRKKIAAATKVSRKVFEGRRLGLLFFIFKRNRANTLYSSEPELNRHMRGGKLWMVPLTASLTSPGLEFTENLEASRDLFWNEVSRHQATLNETDTNRVLIDEATEKGVNPEILKGLFAEIEALFNSEDSRRLREAKLFMMEGFIGEFIPHMIRRYVSEIRSEVRDRDSSWRALKAVTRLQWTTGRIPYVTNMYLDYLRSVTLVGNTNHLAYQRDMAKDYFVNFFGALEILGQLKDIPDPERIIEVNNDLKLHLKTMKARRFWINKAATHKFLPIGQTVTALLGLSQKNYFRKRPVCARLYY